jgi:hypothetical protein
MSDSYAVKYQEGYQSLAGGIGSGSAMFGFDKISGAGLDIIDKGIGSLAFAKAIYNFSKDGGATGVITPYYGATVPAGAVCIFSTVNATTPPVGSGNISAGFLTGGSATQILGATAYNNAIFATDAGVNVGLILPTSGNIFKTTAQAPITFTLSGTLTAGVIEVNVVFFIAAAL